MHFIYNVTDLWFRNVKIWMKISSKGLLSFHWEKWENVVETKLFQQRDGEVRTFHIGSVNSCGTLYYSTRMGSCLDIDWLVILSSSFVTHIEDSPDFPLPFFPSAHSWLLSSHSWLLADPCLAMVCRQLVFRFVAVRRLPSQRVVRGYSRPLRGQGAGPPD